MATRAENEGPPAALGTATPCDLEAVTGGPEYGAMQLLNDATGWVLVDQRLKWTDDGGESWRDITPPDLELSDAQFNAGELADFLNRSTGWVFASRPRGPDAPSDLSVWRTTSGGVTWQKASLDGPSGDGSEGPPIFYPLALQFVDAQHGWFALSYAGGTMGGTSFYATKDGGASWSQVGGPHGFTGASGPVHFAGANDGWQAWESPEANAYVTHDGGQNWQATSFSQPAGLGDAWAWNGPFSSGDLGAGNGVIPADHYGGDGPEDAKTGIYVTHDAGRTWTFANPTPAQGGVMYFVSPEIWVQATEEHVFVTQNGGVDWEAADAAWPEAQADMCSREPLRLAFADADHGWALVRTNQVGASGTAVELALLATEDRGHTWRILSP